MDYHFIREEFEKEDVVLVYVNTADQVAGFLTMAVNKNKLNYVLSKLGIVNLSTPT